MDLPQPQTRTNMKSHKPLFLNDTFYVVLRVLCICLALFATIVWLVGCATAPEIIRPKGLENPVLVKLRNDANSTVPVTPSYSWLWWYAPLAIISLLWTIKYLFLRKCVEEDIDVVEEDKKENNHESRPTT